MYSRISNSLFTVVPKYTRSLSSSKTSNKVAVLGAAGGIGQPLSLLCKLSEHIDELSCYDIVGTPGKSCWGWTNNAILIILLKL